MDTQSPPKLALQGADVLTPQGWLSDATVLIDEGRFVAVDQTPKPSGYIGLDVSGLRLVPGIVDIHGDAFERKICPRPGVTQPLPMAMVENDRALLAAGITTFFYSITDSFEPGLRSRATARSIVEYVYGEVGKSLLADSRIHIRHEQANTAHFEELCDWLQTGQVNLLSLNDHLPPSLDDDSLHRYTKGMRQRIKVSDDEVRAIVRAAMDQREAGLQQLEDLVMLAHQVEVPVASHDDETAEDVATSRRRQVAIAEFPASIDLAAQSRAYGAAVLMGAPNLVRGGSHVGYMGVTDAVEAQVLDCLCSDYHYPSLFYAPFKLVALGLMELAQAWKLVSEYPARAAGLGDCKGAIAPGYAADALLLRPETQFHDGISAVYIGGREVARYG
ncbi:alpha-D-ribose 1-methylphosphonate 5-triphosphate diphosphatase [Nodosilinea sp. LEGE 07088]|uniref:alpha-D-ribose 1-methylphosphonate 5-triphosphate diphosphatase n=1 Tax=Nodosilinea sp. LEGE 07088 TaxID=2777968 RepID=UPI002107EDC1|nr:alpha-D-ribose 1-methylphosphonate 5-triphosphate diphosphatase [Nodosilinea sp. LEGE 07088]